MPHRARWALTDRSRAGFFRTSHWSLPCPTVQAYVRGRRPRGANMEFRLLGPLDVRGDGGQVLVAGHRTRALLCALLVRADEVVSTGQLIDALWGDRPPP